MSVNVPFKEVSKNIFKYLKSLYVKQCKIATVKRYIIFQHL